MAVAIWLLMLMATAADDASLTDQDLLQRAEAAFHEGTRTRDDSERSRLSFRIAASSYEALRARGANSVALYRNLGNAWFQAGDLPRAILAYRRGLNLDPADRHLHEALAAAREQVLASSASSIAPPADDWPPWLPYWSPVGRLALTTLGYVVACVLVTRWWMKREPRLLLMAGAAGAIALALGATLTFEEWLRRSHAERPLVVVARERATLHKGNGDAYPPHEQVPTLAAGVEARLLHRRGDWLQIELANGVVGWLRADQALLDTP